MCTKKFGDWLDRRFKAAEGRGFQRTIAELEKLFPNPHTQAILGELQGRRLYDTKECLCLFSVVYRYKNYGGKRELWYLAPDNEYLKQTLTTHGANLLELSYDFFAIGDFSGEHWTNNADKPLVTRYVSIQEAFPHIKKAGPQ